MTTTQQPTGASAAALEALKQYRAQGQITKADADAIRDLLRRDPKAAIQKVRAIRTSIQSARLARLRGQ